MLDNVRRECVVGTIVPNEGEAPKGEKWSSAPLQFCGNPLDVHEVTVAVFMLIFGHSRLADAKSIPPPSYLLVLPRNRYLLGFAVMELD